MRFSWTPQPNAVYQLTLATASGDPDAELPRIDIVTARPTASWPDLSGVGIVFPQSLAAYRATVAARGPLASVDQRAAPRDLAAKGPRDRWKSESQDLSVPVQPPLGKQEAECQKLNVDVIVCGPGPAGLSHREERYVTSAMNKKLRSYPDFANAANIHCVHDCASARAFSKAYEDYEKSHPGFDANQPLEPIPPPPPPPPGFFGQQD
jgi:hypothetical protein